MDVRSVKISSELEFTEKTCERKVPCSDIFTHYLDTAADYQEVCIRDTLLVENHVEQPDEKVTERRTGYLKEDISDEDVSCSPKMGVDVAVDMTKPKFEERETTRTVSGGGAGSVVSTNEGIEGNPHTKCVVDRSSSTATSDHVTSIFPQDPNNMLREGKRGERDKQNRNNGRENEEKEQWMKNKNGSSPLPWSKQKKKDLASTDQNNHGQQAKENGGGPTKEPKKYNVMYGRHDDVSPNPVKGSSPLPWSKRKKKEFESTYQNNHGQQGKENVGGPTEEPKKYGRHDDINPNPVKVGEHVKKKHRAALIFSVNTCSFTLLQLLKALLYTGALLANFSGALAQELSCINHPHNENAVLCLCGTMGDGSHIWGFNWLTTCTRDELTFSPRQHEPKSCNSSSVAISGYGSSTNGPFTTDVVFEILDVNFHGIVNCSILRPGPFLENIGHFILSAPTVICHSFYFDNGILTIQLADDSHSVPSNRLRAMLRHSVTNATKIINDTNGAMQIVASLRELGLEAGSYYIDIEATNNVDSILVHCEGMVFHPGESSGMDPGTGADTSPTSSSETTINRSVIMWFQPLLAIGTLLVYTRT